MDMRGMGVAFTRLLPDSVKDKLEERAETKALAIEAFHDRCFVYADSPSLEDVNKSIDAHFDYPDETCRAILRQASFTAQDVKDFATTVEEGSLKHERLVNEHLASFDEDDREFGRDCPMM